jgi:hypothetical protein
MIPKNPRGVSPLARGGVSCCWEFSFCPRQESPCLSPTTTTNFLFLAGILQKINRNTTLYKFKCISSGSMAASATTLRQTMLFYGMILKSVPIVCLADTGNSLGGTMRQSGLWVLTFPNFMQFRKTKRGISWVPDSSF